MGDRNNPIKFGPEWLRNLARERNAGRGSSTPQSGTRPGPGAGSRTPGSQGPVRARSGSPLGGSGASGAGTGSAGSGPVGACGPVVSAFPVAGASGTSSRHASNSQYPKVQLANLRYGREEMLALFDRNAEPPEELKYFDLLYHPRGKPPVALNTYEEDTREARAGAGPERYGAGRGRGMPPEVRGRSRMPFVRHSSAVSAGSNRRQANNTNWRQACRDEGDEWRYQETSRPPNRSTADKWDRDWSERPSQERPQSWAPSRRQWAGDTTNEDNLPEWAIDSAEAGAGSFDSSGAFHGYSNDDSNLPRTQETTYPLTRSHTHGGSISRSKTVEEGSEEWWSSEKAKKLSPKRFEAGDSRFKKASSAGTEEVSGGGNSTKQIASTEKSHQLDSLQGSSESISDPSNNAVSDDKQHDLRQKISDNKTFEAFMRSDIEFPETAENKGNFQSVMINSNRGLRQQHQNIVTPINETSMSRQQQMNANGLLQILHGRQMSENDGNEASQANEDSIVDEFIDMTLEDNPNRPNVPLQPGAITPGMMNQRHLMRIPGSAVAHQGQAQGMPNVSMANVGNQSMNNLGMNMAPGSGHGLPMQGLLPPAMNPMNPAMGPTIGPVLQHRVIGAFQQNAGLPVMPTPNVANNSLFMGQNAQQMPTSDMQSHTAPPNLFPMHGMQHGNPGFSSIYSNILPPNNIGGNMSSNMGNMSSNMGNMSNMGHMGNMSNMGNMGNMGHMGNMGTNLTANVGANMAGNIGSNIGANIGAHMAGNIAGNMGGDIVGNLSGTIGGAIGGNLGCNSGNNLTATMSGNMGGNIPGNIGSNISDQWFYEDPKDVLPSYPISGFEPRPQNHDLLNQQPPLTMEESLWGQPSNNQDLSMWMQQMPRADQSSKMTIFFWDQEYHEK